MIGAQPIEPTSRTVPRLDGTSFLVHAWAPRGSPWLRVLAAAGPGVNSRTFSVLAQRLARFSVAVESVDLPGTGADASWDDLRDELRRLRRRSRRAATRGRWKVEDILD